MDKYKWYNIDEHLAQLIEYKLYRYGKVLIPVKKIKENKEKWKNKLIHVSR